jgi:hypothetical protein
MDEFWEKYGELLEGKSPEVIEQCRQRYEQHQKDRAKDEEIRRLVIQLKQNTGASYTDCWRLIRDNYGDYDKALLAWRNEIRESMRKWSPFI